MIRELDPRLVAAVILAEDRRFWSHRGVDWSAVWAALVVNRRERHVRFGASTIAMQVARLLRGWTKPSYTRKLGEMAFALWLTARYDRETILEVYLNLAPFASGTRGVARGSARLAERDPSCLSLFEATTIAIALNDPEGVPGATPESTNRVRFKQLRLIRELVNSGQATESEANDAAAQVVAAFPNPHEPAAEVR